MRIPQPFQYQGSKRNLAPTILQYLPVKSERIITSEFGDLPVVSPEGLIYLKSIRGSGLDEEDIRNLRELNDKDGKS